MSGVRDHSLPILMPEHFYELSKDDMLKWCQRAVKEGYIVLLSAVPQPMYGVTEKGGAYLESCLRQTVMKHLDAAGRTVSADHFNHVLDQYRQWKMATTNPVVCIVQCMYEAHDYKNAMN